MTMSNGQEISHQKKLIRLAYGALWRVNVESNTDIGRDLIKARKLLLKYLDFAGQSHGIRLAYEALPPDPEAGQPWVPTYDEYLKGTNSA